MKQTLTLVVLVGLISCGGKESSSSAIVTERLHAPSAAASERAEVELEWPNGGPPLNELFSLEVRVNGSAQCTVQVNADMPAHGHGMLSKPVVTSSEPGHYLVEGMLMHMPGDWVVFVDVQEGGMTSRSEFPITLDF